MIKRSFLNTLSPLSAILFKVLIVFTLFSMSVLILSTSLLIIDFQEKLIFYKCMYSGFCFKVWQFIITAHDKQKEARDFPLPLPRRTAPILYAPSRFSACASYI